MCADTGGVTRLLRRWSEGDSGALDEIIPIVYSELQSLAHRQLRREHAAHTLQTTALVNEAYLRLAGQESKDWKNRGHFLAVCAQILRQVLVDAARTRRAQKRNSGQAPIPIPGDLPVPAGQTDASLIALDDSLAELARIDPLKARIVDLRYFGGFTVEEIAALLDISPATVKRHWAIAKAWLYNELAARDAQPLEEPQTDEP
ncbi:MAG: sigma-70 family RNA polymerase sigma factor [Bryobacteraceae bacterium]